MAQKAQTEKHPLDLRDEIGQIRVSFLELSEKAMLQFKLQ